MKMKKLLAILPFLALPINSIAADKASNDAIDATINMIMPTGYCNILFLPNPSSSQFQDWYAKSEKVLSECYKQAETNTSLLPTDNPEYEKCLIGDLITIKRREILEKKKQSTVSSEYFSDKSFLNRFSKITKGLNSHEMREYHEFLANTFEVIQDRLPRTCYQYFKQNQ
ncbi:hypothetical protein [Commensalibacter communis]|uniref:hypothetical protein n=2 Tax=Commensalibacter communis TaxID=2972786 RepID=UPI0024924F90|nr:hypothetical protein [Commensalibacter communis]